MVAISVVVPTLNEEKYLATCLKSLNNQTIPRKEYEVIVSDGGSSDRTVKIAKQHGARVVVCKKKGISTGINAGIRAAKGDIIAVTHADSICPPWWLSRITGILKKHDMVFGPALFDEVKSPHKRLNAMNEVAMSFWKLSAPLGVIFCDSRNCGYTKKVFEKNGLMDEETPADDVFFNMRLKKVKTFFDPLLLVMTSERRATNKPFLNAVHEWFTVPSLSIMKKMGHDDYRQVR